MYEGEIVKLAKVRQMWLVEDGERHPIADQAELWAVGLRKVNTISEQALNAIPLEGQKQKRADKAPAPKPLPEPED